MHKTQFLTEWESADLLKLLRDSSALFKQMGETSSLRKELRVRLLHQSEEIEFWVQRRKDTLTVDEGMIRALETIRLERNTTLSREMESAFDLYITQYNRRR